MALAPAMLEMRFEAPVDFGLEAAQTLAASCAMQAPIVSRRYVPWLSPQTLAASCAMQEQPPPYLLYLCLGTAHSK